MKILYLITQSDLGGAQKYVFDLALAFKKEFNVVVAAGKQTGELFNELNKENIRSIALKHLKRLPNPLGILLCFLEIRKLVKKERPDILHLNSTIAGFLGSLAVLNLKTKPKIVYTVHGWAFLEPNALKKILFYLLEKTTASLKDKFIILSEFEKQVALKKKICSKTKITIIPNGIEKIKFFSKETAREKLGLIEKNKAIVGVIANPYKTKGLKYLLKAWPEAVIVGDGPEKNKLQKQFPRAIFLGKIDKAAQCLKAFDIFCLPSVKEGFPFVLLEAMQAQLPIIATKVGAIPEIIENGKQGLLVAPKNSLVLKEKIEELLLNKPKAQLLAKNAALRAENYTLKKTVSRTKNLYECLLP